MFDVYSLLQTVGGMVIGGGIVHAFKRYTENSDNHDKTIPVVSKAIQTIEESICKMNASVKELYESRDKHNVQIAEINMLHRVLKCVDKVDGE